MSELPGQSASRAPAAPVERDPRLPYNALHDIGFDQRSGRKITQGFAP
jgi:hypothetical protein